MVANCPDCNVAPGHSHISGCDVERCSVCKLQKLMCQCENHNPELSVWEGEWPGVSECRKRGWFCTDGHYSHPRFGPFRPCSPKTPGAMEDINRFVRFTTYGVDDLYQGL
jgi:hypothetical protein